MRSRTCILWFALAVAACDYYDKPNRPLPPDFKAVMLDGTKLDREGMKGQAWVIALWVPG
jgi:hypothetical protein